MKKIPSLFQRNYETDRMVRNEVVPGCEWVLNGEGVATVKWDGTAVMVRDGRLFKRYDRKRHKKTGEYKPAPDGWEPCEESPNEHTGHWPGWVPVGEEPESRWHRVAWQNSLPAEDGTYEAIGPHFQGNPHGALEDILAPHGKKTVHVGQTFAEIRDRLGELSSFEGVVWHHQDGRMAKIKRRDFGFSWPAEGRS